MPHAIVHPYAVVIHAQHASLAHATVMRARRFMPLALLTKSVSATLTFGFNKHLPATTAATALDAWRVVRWHFARVSQHRARVHDPPQTGCNHENSLGERARLPARRRRTFAKTIPHRHLIHVRIHHKHQNHGQIKLPNASPHECARARTASSLHSKLSPAPNRSFNPYPNQRSTASRSHTGNSPRTCTQDRTGNPSTDTPSRSSRTRARFPPRSTTLSRTMSARSMMTLKISSKTFPRINLRGTP
mmetsp:Transcript_4330/g.15879  ORF Transcript_4330/g.15879 Transcript_4330/m.15879 type:complete len:246 (+) Transcript_4330:555-1292(+)